MMTIAKRINSNGYVGWGYSPERLRQRRVQVIADRYGITAEEAIAEASKDFCDALDIAEDEADSPPFAEPVYDNVPDELRARRQWVLWRADWSEDTKKYNKVPIQCDGRGAKSNDSTTWTDYDTAVTACRTMYPHDAIGIGYVFSEADPYVGIDLDDARDAETGEPIEWAAPLLKRLKYNYIEVSPSESGYKSIIRGDKTCKWCSRPYKSGKVEIFEKHRYFTITGRRIGDVDEIADGQEALAWLSEIVEAENTRIRQSSREGDQSRRNIPTSNVIEQARRYIAEIPPAVAGEGGHNATFYVACRLVHGFDLSIEDATEAIAEWNKTCQPPWSAEEIQHKLESAAECDTHEQSCGHLLQQNARTNENKIRIGPDEYRVNRKSLELLGGDPMLYRRGGNWSQIIGGNKPEIVRSPQSMLRDRLSERCYYYQDKQVKDKETGEDIWIEVHKAPPEHAVSYVAEIPEVIGARKLAGVVTAPTLRADGSIVDTPGWDELSGLVYVPDRKYPEIPAEPSREQINAAIELLRDLVGDFPLKDRDADFSAWLAVILTIAGREMIDGPTPMMTFDGNRARVGKGKLAGLASIIATGTKEAVKTLPSADDEVRKWITSVAIAGSRVKLIDNITHKVEYASLDAALTTTHWSDRILATNISYDGPWRTVLMATANNIELGNDVSYRVLPIRLLDSAEDPSARVVKRLDIEGYTQRHRAELYVAALTIMRGYVAAGMPEHVGTPWGSYEAWSPVIRGCLVWAGLPDPYTTREKISTAEANEDTPLKILIRDWHKLVYRTRRKPLTAEMIYEELCPPHGMISDPLRDMRAALDDNNSGRAKPIQQTGSRGVGKALSKLVNVNVDGIQLVKRAGDKASRGIWQMERIEEPGVPWYGHPQP